MKFKRAPLLVYLCLLPLLLALGFWQLNRAEEKRALLRLQQQQQSAGMLPLTDNSPDSLDFFLYRPIKTTGHYDSSHQFLLDNQVRQGKVGYFVLTPLLLRDEKKAVLVNRGWVALGNSRSDLPEVSVPQDEITITGLVNRFPRVAIKLQDAEIIPKQWPAVIQAIDIDRLSKLQGYPLFNFQVELDKAQPHGFIREWHKSVAMTPEKHTGYAVQWFLLALTLTVLFLKYGITDNKGIINNNND